MSNEEVTKFYDYVAEIASYGLETQDYVNWCNHNEFFTATASSGHHGNYAGGLLHHTLVVTDNLVNYTRCMGLHWNRSISPVLVGLLHDICKVDTYELIKGDYKYKDNNSLLFTGHGDKSVLIASTLFKLTEEEVCCIRYHTGAYVDKSEWPNLGNAQKRYETVIWTHQADMCATRSGN